jgi:hypothetical protein
MKTLPILFALGSLLFVATARAQWQTTNYTLKDGWNAIYLSGDATYATLDSLFPNSGNTQCIQEVWRWNPNPNQVQFTQTPLIPSAGTPEWSVWVRGGSANKLTQMIGQSAYLVKCTGTSMPLGTTVPIKQSPLTPSANWVRNGANLLGFPTHKTGSNYPLFSSYFATFPAAIAANASIFKYVGGDLGANNPSKVFAASSDRVDRTQAYWFSSEVVGNFYAPLEVSTSTSGGLSFGKTRDQITLRVHNRSAAPVTLTLDTTTSEPAPVAQPGITGPVPLTRGTYPEGSIILSWAPITAANNTAVIAPQSTVELYIGIDRLAMLGLSGSFYASFLHLSDNGNLMDIYLPATASKSSLAGLWVGEASVTNVSNRVADGARAVATIDKDGKVTGIKVVGGGSGYTTAPTVTVAPPGVERATATATITSGGVVDAVKVTYKGFGYGPDLPAVTVSPPTVGSRALAATEPVNGMITSVDVLVPGTGYFTAPDVTVPAPDPVTSASATSVLSGSMVDSIAVDNGGSGYFYPTIITVTSTEGLTAGMTVTGTGITSPTTILKVTDGTQLLLSQNIANATNDLIYGGVTTLSSTSSTAIPVVTVAAPPEGTRATAVAMVSGGSIIGFTISNPGNGYTVPPTVTLSVPPAATPATLLATVADGVITGISVTDPGSGYTFSPLVTIATPPPGTTAVLTPTLVNGTVSLVIQDGGSGYLRIPTITIAPPPAASDASAAVVTAILGSDHSVKGFTIDDGGIGYKTAPVVTIDFPPVLTGTTTPSPFPLRTLLHVADGGTARLLSQVFIGQLASNPYPVGVCTREALLKQDAKATAQRIVAAHLPLDQVITGSGKVEATGVLTCTITLPFNGATNPFVHQYHPDHDNKDARFNLVSAGVESYNITRTCTFMFTAGPAGGGTWGSSVIGGNYSEVISGLHKDPIQLNGTFELRRASEIGVLTQ